MSTICASNEPPGARDSTDANASSSSPRAPLRGLAVQLPRVRMSASELAALTLHAQETGQTLSEFVRRAIRRTIAQDRLARRLQAERDALRAGVWADLDTRHPKTEET